MGLAQIHVEGITPLLSNSPRGMIEQAKETVKTRKSIPTAEVEAELGCYWNAQGNLCFPTMAFRKCCINGAKGRKVGRTGLNTILAGAVFPYDEWTDLVDPDTGKPICEYQVFTVRAVPPGQGAVLRSRPRVDHWAADVRLEFDDDVTDEAAIRSVLAAGGMRVGVGNWRPEKGGTYGRFRVVEPSGITGDTRRKRAR